MKRKSEQFIQAISVSEGVAVAQIQVIPSEIEEVSTSCSCAQASQELWQKLVQKAKRQIRTQMRSYQEQKAETSILTAHLTLLQDPYFQSFVQKQLERGRAIHIALKLALEHWRAQFKQHKHSFCQDRILDLQDVVLRLLRLYYADSKVAGWPQALCIYMRQALPSSLVQVPAAKLKAVVCQEVSRASHLAILARARGIPCLSQVVLPANCEQSLAIIDGYEGCLILNPTKRTLQKYASKRYQSVSGLASSKHVRASDVNAPRYWANIDTLTDIEQLPAAGYEGIGLVRTEYMVYEKGRIPSVRAQASFYKRIVRSQKGRGVVIRLFDFGSDKPGPSMRRESNPALGCRGVRFLLKEPKILQDQLAAILQASKEGPLSILVPMVCQPQQMALVRAMMAEVAERLHIQKIPKLGMMVEIPAVALILDQFEQVSEFFSIGSNDLLQYLHAVDRTNCQVQDLYNSSSSALLQLLGLIVQSATKMHKPVSLCGEMAVDASCRQRLARLGLHDFSISPYALRHALKLS